MTDLLYRFKHFVRKSINDDCDHSQDSKDGSNKAKTFPRKKDIRTHILKSSLK